MADDYKPSQSPSLGAAIPKPMSAMSLSEKLQHGLSEANKLARKTINKESGRVKSLYDEGKSAVENRVEQEKKFLDEQTKPFRKGS